MQNSVKVTTLLAIALGLALSGCAAVLGPPPALGSSLAAVEARLGTPTAVYPTADGQALEYRSGPAGQFTYMARFGADGRLRAYEQVLTSETFATLQVGKATREDVLRAVGQPAERSSLPRQQFEVWSYRYKENGVWNSMMHLHFDPDGVLRLAQNGPDPMFEEHPFHFFR